MDSKVWRQEFDFLAYINQMEHINVDFGPMNVIFSWEEKFREVGYALKSWFGDYSSGRVQSHMGFLISPSIFKNVIRTDSTQRIVQIWSWDAVLVTPSEGLQLWVCNPRMTLRKYLAKAIPKWLFRFLNPLGASYWELQAGYLLYHIVLKEIQIALLKNNASFIHAAGLSNNFGNAVLICGRGGIGKTTTATYFVSRGPWKIIADDFVIVSHEGKMYGSHLPAHIYGYHIPIINQLGLRENKLFKGCLDKLQWNIYSVLKSPSWVVRRISLPKDIIGLPSIIKMCFVVEVTTSDYKEVSVQRIDHEEAARLSLQYTFAEMGFGGDSQKKVYYH